MDRPVSDFSDHLEKGAVPASSRGCLTPGRKGELVYQVGDVDPDRVRVDWGPAVSYGGGRRPFVSLHNGQLIEVHQGKNKDKLFCQIGDVDTKRQQITFSAATSYDEQGRSPSIALSDK